MTNAEKAIVSFVCLLLTGFCVLAGALVWQNATSPAYTVESCVEVKVTRSTP